MGAASEKQYNNLSICVVEHPLCLPKPDAIMRLFQLDNDRFSLTKFAEDEVPPYAILSNVWEPDGAAVTYKEISCHVL